MRYPQGGYNGGRSRSKTPSVFASYGLHTADGPMNRYRSNSEAPSGRASSVASSSADAPYSRRPTIPNRGPLSRPPRAGSSFGSRSYNYRTTRSTSTASTSYPTIGGFGTGSRSARAANDAIKNYEAYYTTAPRPPPSGPVSYVGGRRSVSVIDGDTNDDGTGINDHQRAADYIREDDENWIAVVSESKGAGRTVGIAAYQPSTAQCILTQLNDSQTYIKTVHTLSVRWPSVICVIGNNGQSTSRMAASLGAGGFSAGSIRPEETLLVKTLSTSFDNTDTAPDNITETDRGESATARAMWGGGRRYVPVTGIQRRYFDAVAGEDFVKQLILQDDETAVHLTSVHGQYYALSAAAALFKYLEMMKSWIFAPHSVRIKYQPLEGTMIIDANSARNLQLVENMIERGSSKKSLFGFLCHSYTPMAARLLRNNILSPLTQRETIELRLEVVSEFTANDDMHRATRKAMKPIERIDADKLAGDILAATSLKDSEKMNKRKAKNFEPSRESEWKIELVLKLRAFIKAMPAIKQALTENGGAQSSLLKTVAKILEDPRLQTIEDLVTDTLNETALAGMGNTALKARTSRVFAIKAERKRLLDVARETYKENVSDVDDLLQDLQNQYPDEGLQDIELNYSAQAGFTFVIPEETVAEKMGGELPKIFHKVGKKGRKLQISCVALLKRNERIKQSLDEVFLLSSDVLDELLLSIRDYIAALYRCSEVIGMLDMLASFAHVAITSASYNRPEFTDTLAIKEGRHPLLERFNNDEAFVPNDTYATEAASFQLITGPNMSGKTTFLKQVALLVVMSQIGCFVPAEYASFRIHHALLTRLSNDDSLEGNLSTFALEMQTMAMILSGLSTTENALVIIDELGRGTSPQEGVGLAHAIAEEIIRSKAYCFFATHFIDLATTLSVYHNVVTLHLETDVAPAAADGTRRDKDFALSFTHRVRDGRTTAQNYGLEIAKVAALPDNMLKWARQATEKLTELEELRRRDAEGTKVVAKRKVILNTANNLRQAFRSSRLDDDRLRTYVSGIVEEAVNGLTQDIEEDTTRRSEHSDETAEQSVIGGDEGYDSQNVSSTIVDTESPTADTSLTIQATRALSMAPGSTYSDDGNDDTMQHDDTANYNHINLPAVKLEPGLEAEDDMEESDQEAFNEEQEVVRTRASPFRTLERSSLDLPSPLVLDSMRESSDTHVNRAHTPIQTHPSPSAAYSPHLSAASRSTASYSRRPSPFLETAPSQNTHRRGIPRRASFNPATLIRSQANAPVATLDPAKSPIIFSRSPTVRAESPAGSPSPQHVTERLPLRLASPITGYGMNYPRGSPSVRSPNRHRLQNTKFNIMNTNDFYTQESHGDDIEQSDMEHPPTSADRPSDSIQSDFM